MSAQGILSQPITSPPKYIGKTNSRQLKLSIPTGGVVSSDYNDYINLHTSHLQYSHSQVSSWEATRKTLKNRPSEISGSPIPYSGKCSWTQKFVFFMVEGGSTNILYHKIN